MFGDILTAKIAIASAMTFLCLLALRHQRVQKRLTSASWRMITIAFFLPRLAAFVALYVIAKLPAQSDMVVYLDHSRWVLNGQRPFIDFETAYGPWFLYVCSWALRIWNSAGALVLLAVIAEFAAWPLWIRLMKSLLGEQEAKLTAWIYSLAPLAFLNVPMIGLNHVWLTAFLGLALLWQHRRQQLLAGLAMGASIVVVKFLSLLWVPLMFWNSQKKTTWLLGFCLLPLIAYGVLVHQGVDLLAQVTMHAHYDSSGNVPFLFGIGGIDPSTPSVRSVFNVIGVVGLVIGFIACVITKRLSNMRQLFFALPLFLLIALLLSKKSFSSYLEMTLFPLAALVVLERGHLKTVVWFCIAMLTTSIEPSLWFRWLHQQELWHLIYESNAEWQVPAWQLSSFIAVEFLMLTSYVILGRQLWQQLGTQHEATINPS